MNFDDFDKDFKPGRWIAFAVIGNIIYWAALVGIVLGGLAIAGVI